jgi:hypothetical protein
VAESSAVAVEAGETRVAARDFLLVRGRTSETVGILEAGSKGWVARVEVVAVDGRGGELEEAEEGEEVEEEKAYPAKPSGTQTTRIGKHGSL